LCSLNKVRESSANVKDIVEFLEHSVGVPVVGVVPFDNRVPEASNAGHPVLAYAPGSSASKAISGAGGVLQKWVFGEEKKGSLFRRLYEAFVSLFRGPSVPAGKKF